MLIIICNYSGNEKFLESTSIQREVIIWLHYTMIYTTTIYIKSIMGTNRQRLLSILKDSNPIVINVESILMYVMNRKDNFIMNHRRSDFDDEDKIIWEWHWFGRLYYTWWQSYENLTLLENSSRHNILNVPCQPCSFVLQFRTYSSKLNFFLK